MGVCVPLLVEASHTNWCQHTAASGVTGRDEWIIRIQQQGQCWPCPRLSRAPSAWGMQDQLHFPGKDSYTTAYRVKKEFPGQKEVGIEHFRPRRGGLVYSGDCWKCAREVSRVEVSDQGRSYKARDREAGGSDRTELEIVRHQVCKIRPRLQPGVCSGEAGHPTALVSIPRCTGASLVNAQARCTVTG